MRGTDVQSMRRGVRGHLEGKYRSSVDAREPGYRDFRMASQVCEVRRHTSASAARRPPLRLTW
eukprot:1780851-Pyramimonas_sp.AAC.1